MSRRLVLVVLALLAATAVAAGEDAKKVELVYRWDLLDGKTALYDCEVTSKVTVDRKVTAEGSGEVDKELSDEGAPTQLETTTRTKQRLAVKFARGDRDRGRVTFEAQRLEVSFTQKRAGVNETITYDSANASARVPPELKKMVDAMLGKPYTLTVSRRGTVEAIEGRPRSELDAFKGTFLLLPSDARATGEGWTRTQRVPTEPLGLIVTRWSYVLAKVTEDDRTVEAKITTELDDSVSRLPIGASARIEGAHGSAKVVLDPRGLKKEEEERTGYELVVRQVSPDLEQRNKLESITTWKLVEVR